MSEHRHWLTFHRHPNWHGHCKRQIERCQKCGSANVDRGYLSRERDTVECDDCGQRHIDYKPTHSCHRWHFHLPFTHKHTRTGR